MYFTDQLEENMTWLNQALHVDKNFDVVYRVLTIADKKPACILLMVLQKMTLLKYCRAFLLSKQMICQKMPTAFQKNICPMVRSVFYQTAGK